ncbi:hypothetical protein Bca52824_034055 [Brassica carinata]|uniref:Lactoylglutathione lyase n=1 Tax=Brassica carinata TaxID=52824 RepID=A0A8X7SE01_BRACI|nr:hypothetical protein Bca52824_034055 [Brassica carinata]
MASEAKESPANNPGLSTVRDEATKGCLDTCLVSCLTMLAQLVNMFRVKDPKASLDFYSRVLGMSPQGNSNVLKAFMDSIKFYFFASSSFSFCQIAEEARFLEMKFSLYFLGYEDTSTAPTDPTERTVWTFGRPATIELTHNWGTESDPEFKGYHNGNSEPRGFGHIGVTVDDVHKACERFEQLGVEFAKKPMMMKNIAFIKDPDGYWIEIFDLKTIGTTAGNAA